MAEITPEELLGMIGQLNQIAGRFKTFIILRGDEEPTNVLGAPGAFAFNQDTRTWYGPKDEVTGWPPGVVVTQGPPGPSIQLQVTATHIQWRVVGTSTWNNLIALASITGPAGTITDVTAQTGTPGSAASVTLGGTPSARTIALTIPRGDVGATPALSIGAVTTVGPDENAEATFTGTVGAPILNLALPQGAPGEDADITEVTVETGPAGSGAEVVLGGEPGSRTFAFTLPRGDTGQNATITDITVQTGAPGSDADVVLGGTPAARTLALTIPRGDVGVTPNVSVAIQMVAHGQPATVTRSGADATPLLTFSLPSPLDGEDGREVEFNVSATHIQTRYVGDVAWTNLIALAALKGPKGDKGDAFAVNATGEGLTARAAYDSEGPGFSFVDTETGLIYFRQGETPGVWSDGVPFGVAQNDILDALGALDAAPGVLVQTGAATFEKREIGAGSDGDLLDRQSADGRYRRASLAVPMEDITGLQAALDDKADATAVVVALGGKADVASTYTKAEVDTALGGKQAALGFTPENAANKGEANGYAGLGADGKVPSAQLPDPPTVPVKASGAELRALTNDAKFLTPKSVADAAALVALTDAATIAVDLAAGTNFTVTLGGNRTLGAPSNAKPGMTGTILVKQDATGSRTLAYNTAWKPFGSTPALSTAANAVDLLTFIVEDSGKVRFTLAKGGAA